MTHGRAGVRRAFTLLEAIVTMGIVATLLAILVPSVRSVQEAGRSTRCAANLRQMAMAALSYATHYGETMPAALLYRARPEGLAVLAWDFEQRADGTVLPGPMWKFTNDPSDILRCPSYHAAEADAIGGEVPSGYNYNTSYIGAEGRWPELAQDGTWLDGWSVARRGIPVAQHRRPSETALFGDAGRAGGTNRFMRAPSAAVEGDLGTVYAGGQAFRHIGCTNVAHLDGHVESHCQACEGSNGSPALLEQILGWPRNGFLSDADGRYDPR